MASHNRDLESGIPDIRKDAGSLDARSTLATPPPGVMYTEDVPPVPMPEPQPSLQVPQRSKVVSMSSALSYTSDSELEKFRAHLGIHNNRDLSEGRAATNIGLYQRIATNEASAHRQYKISAVVINSALGLQLIFAAALTALGAAKGSSAAVTAFGAMNTVLAGLLTFVKGSGLPNRFKYYENEWAKVREYIEQRERDFAHVGSHDSSLDLLKEITVIERMYETVRSDVEANTPDNYISINKSTSGTQPGPSLARNLHRLSDIEEGVKEKFGQIRHDIDSRIHGARDTTGSHLQDAGNAYSSQVRNSRRYLDDEKSRLQSASREIQTEADTQIHNMHGAADARLKEMQEKIKEGEKKAKEVEEKVVAATEKAMGKVMAFMNQHKDKHGEGHGSSS